MYIKIKMPLRENLRVQLIVTGLLSTVIFGLLFSTFLSSDSLLQMIASLQESFATFKQEEGLLAALIILLVFLAIPTMLVYSIYQWVKQRHQWLKPDIPYALDFTPQGIAVYTRQGMFFLPAEQTTVLAYVTITTVRSKNASYPALDILTLTLQQENNPPIQIKHKPSLKQLFALAGEQNYFKQFDFRFEPNEPYDKGQASLSKFMLEQTENQRLFGLHCRYRSHIGLALTCILTGFVGITFIGIFVSCMEFPPNDSFFFCAPLLLPAIGLLCWAGILAFQLVRELRTARKIKRLRSSR